MTNARIYVWLKYLQKHALIQSLLENYKVLMALKALAIAFVFT